MKFNTYKSVAMCSLLALLAGCHDFEEMNTNPYQPVYDPTTIGGTGEIMKYRTMHCKVCVLPRVQREQRSPIWFTKGCITIIKRQRI